MKIKFQIWKCFVLMGFQPSLWVQNPAFIKSFRAVSSQVSLSLSAYYLAVILSALICSRRKHLWWSPNKALMYEYSRVSLGFILLLLFFLKTSIYQWCLEYLVSSSWSRNLCLVSVPSHRVNFVFGWLLLQLFCHYYHYKSKIFVAGLVSVSLLGAYWVPSQTNDTRT